jgi:hypothetical protein
MGTAEGIRRYETWVKSLSSTIAAPETGREENKTMWPGFQAAFGVPWPVKPFTSVMVDGDLLSRRIRGEDRHEAIFKAVDAEALSNGRGPLRVGNGSLAVLGEGHIGLEADEGRRSKDHADLHCQVPVHFAPLAAAHDVLVGSPPRRRRVRDLVVGHEPGREIKHTGR